MIVIWCVYSTVTLLIYTIAAKKPLPPRAPRHLYLVMCCKGSDLASGLCTRTSLPSTRSPSTWRWLGRRCFSLRYLRISSSKSTIRSGLFALFSPFITSHQASFADAGVLLLFYSLYYGCLNRDFAEVATNRMASTIGVRQHSTGRHDMPSVVLQYYSEEGMSARVLPTNTCAVCSQLVSTSVFSECQELPLFYAIIGAETKKRRTNYSADICSTTFACAAGTCLPITQHSTLMYIHTG